MSRAQAAFVCLLQLVRPETFDAPASEEETVLESHSTRPQDETARGRALLAGPAGAMAFGRVILHAAALADAQAFVGRDSAIEEGIMTAQVYPLRISLLAAR